MSKCNILNTIKKLDIEKQRAFTLVDIEKLSSCTKIDLQIQLDAYVKLGILKKNQDKTYSIKNMCHLSQFS